MRRMIGSWRGALAVVGVVVLVTATASSVAAHDHAGAGANGSGGDDKGWSLLANGHQDEHGSVPLDAATQAELDRQLALTHHLVERYPTVAEAVAAGYTRAGPFSPGLGAHYLGGPGVTAPAGGDVRPGDEWILRPVLIYGGADPGSPLVGFMYLISGATAPAGFAGPNDHWHYHTNVCLVPDPAGGINTPLGADRDVTAEQCAAVGGSLIRVTQQMLHVWTVPGWENPDGVFGELNRKITCRDGTYYRIRAEEAGNNVTLCRDEAAPQQTPTAAGSPSLGSAGPVRALPRFTG